MHGVHCPPCPPGFPQSLKWKQQGLHYSLFSVFQPTESILNVFIKKRLEKCSYFSPDVDILSGSENSIGGTKGHQTHKQSIPDEEDPQAFNQSTKYLNNIPQTYKMYRKNM